MSAPSPAAGAGALAPPPGMSGFSPAPPPAMGAPPPALGGPSPAPMSPTARPSLRAGAEPAPAKGDRGGGGLLLVGLAAVLAIVAVLAWLLVSR
ncbi:MAG: hypothetical protein R3B82_06685 [Sandaracinaceae bacterium]